MLGVQDHYFLFFVFKFGKALFGVEPALIFNMSSHETCVFLSKTRIISLDDQSAVTIKQMKIVLFACG